MKAFVKEVYGGPEVLRLEEVEKPTPREGQLLVQVHANSANPADWHILRGKPWLARLSFGMFKPKNKIPGADFAGVVEAVGSGVHDFKAGDRVFGQSLGGGSFAEYTAVEASLCAQMPDRVDFQTMAAVPIAGLTALQALVTHGKLAKGERVLVNGSSGGVGHFVVQIGKALGGYVTAVCSERNKAFVQSLGADEVIAYDRVDIHTHNSSYDLVIDTHGNLKYEDYERLGKRGVVTGFTTMGNLLTLQLRRAVGKFPLVQFTAAANSKDLKDLAKMVEDGRIKPAIEKTFSYKEIPQAISYIEAMRTRGKVVMFWR